MAEETKRIHDPEKYERMSEPYENAAEANGAMAKFLDGVARLREEHRVAEVLVMVAAYHKPNDKGTGVAMQTSAHGSATWTAELGAYAYRHHTLPWVERAKSLRAIAGTEDEKP